MTVINKYPKQKNKTNKEFFERKDKELTNLDWAKWAGWFDTDGCFVKNPRKTELGYQLFVKLQLRDRQPTELFSDTFETSLVYQESNTVTPNGAKYIAKMFKATVSGPKATWFTENVSPYLIKEEKREYAGAVLEDTVRSKNFNTWTKDEVTNYLATVIEGDGSVEIKPSRNKKSINIVISSSDKQYLANLVSIAASKLNINCKFKKSKTYQTKRGTVTMYGLHIRCSKKNPENIDFLRSLLKYKVMTLDRKKEKIQGFVNWFDDKTVKLRLESRV
tara:strand:+ start:55 stop:882 length:828 start_codon:yes stop_codon:yes gene_type:complete